MYPAASRLADYGMHYLASLWTNERAIFQERSAIYGLVAPEGMKIYRASASGLSEEGATVWYRNDDKVDLMRPNELFYIGVSRGSLRKRVQVYKSNARKGWSPIMENIELKRARAHVGTALTRMAHQQKAPIDIYVRYVDLGIRYIEGLPVDILAGLEAGLVQELNPRGNRQFRSFVDA